MELHLPTFVRILRILQTDRSYGAHKLDLQYGLALKSSCLPINRAIALALIFQHLRTEWSYKIGSGIFLPQLPDPGIVQPSRLSSHCVL